METNSPTNVTLLLQDDEKKSETVFSDCGTQQVRVCDCLIQNQIQKQICATKFIYHIHHYLDAAHIFI